VVVSLLAVAAGAGLLAANAFFVAAEFALLAARRTRIEQLVVDGSRAARHALAGMRELSLMLAGAQLGITMASLGLGAVAEPAVARGIEAALGPLAMPGVVRHAVAVTIALAIVVFLHMVVGEMAPKSWAISDPDRSVLRLAPPFRAFALVLRPFIQLLNAAANGVVRLCGVQPQAELALAHSPTDLVLLLEESTRHGTIEAPARELLTRALDLSGLDAEALMVPRRDVVAVAADTGMEQLERIAGETGRSRLPVYEDDLDRIRGILHVKDLLSVPAAQRSQVTAAELARAALVVPESRLLEDLMVDMRQQRQHVAIVVDEYGTVTGLVALEDVLEELIGEFEDETDGLRELPQLRRRRDGSLLVPGSLRPDELADHIGVELPEGEWETVAGFVIATLERLPDVGDVVEAAGARFEVTRMDDHRVVEVAVRPLEPPPTTESLPG
jgi:CBS domain containing-hemolysin-like protein